MFNTARRNAACSILLDFIFQSRGGQALAQRLPVAFKAVCSVPKRNLVKMPVCGSCHDVPALLSHSLDH